MSEDRTCQVLAQLRRSPAGATVDELAESLALHPNTVRFHLARLLRDELIAVLDEPSTNRGRGRPARTYIARHAMDVLGPRQYRILAAILLRSVRDAPDAYAAARDAGADWALSVLPKPDHHESDRQTVARLIEFLDDLDFRPESDGADNEIIVRHCPFMDLAPDPVVCEIHRGLMTGALQHTRVELASLEPFAEPDGCLTRLRARED